MGERFHEVPRQVFVLLSNSSVLVFVNHSAKLERTAENGRELYLRR
jgi:hypothetical protein